MADPRNTEPLPLPPLALLIAGAALTVASHTLWLPYWVDAAAAASTQYGSHNVCDATVRAAPETSSASGGNGSGSVFLGSAMVERQLLQTAIPVRESFTERHIDAREREPIAQAALLGEHDPAGKPRQPRLREHAGGEAIPVEPQLGGGAPREELGEQELAPGRRFPGDVVLRIACLVRPQAREIVRPRARGDHVAGVRVGTRGGQRGRIGPRVHERAHV